MALLTLALGATASSTVYSLTRAVLLKPLPFDRPEQLVDVSATVATEPDKPRPVSVPNFLDWQRQSRTLAPLAAYYRWQVSLTGPGEPDRIWAGLVTHTFFPALRAGASLGRTFSPEEDVPGAPPVAVLSHELWQQRFGGDRQVLGRTVTLDGREHVILGVMPATFRFPRVPLWVPLAAGPDTSPRQFGYLNAVGRLAPGSTLEAARAELTAIAARLEKEYPEANQDRGVLVQPLLERQVGALRPAFSLLGGAVILVLAISFANLVSLFLARQHAREHEVAVRAALGSGRGRLARQPLLEATLLALLGGALGLWLARQALRLVERFGPPRVPRLSEAAIGAPELLATLALALVAAVGATWLALWQSSRLDLARQLGAAGRGLRQGRVGTWFRRVLVAFEIAVALVLLIGAGLLAKSLSRLWSVPPGFDAAGVLTLQVELPETGYAEDHQPAAFFSELYRRVAASPGVEKVGGIFLLPMSGMNATTGFDIAGRAASPGEPKRVASLCPVSPGYFTALRIPVVRGRTFTEEDRHDAPPVAVVSESLARSFWPGEDAVGRQVIFDADFGSTGRLENVPREVVGVVGDVRHDGLDKEPMPTLYFPHLQSSWRMMSLVVRTSTDPLAAVPAVRQAVWSLDRNLPVSEVKPLAQLLADTTAQPRFSAFLFGSFALLALLLAAAGVYGVLSFFVEERTREIGVRMALGADRKDVFAWGLKEVVALTAAGIGAGLVTAGVLTRYLESQLFGLAPWDPFLFAGAALVLALVALAASYRPLRQALKSEPVLVLREDVDARGVLFLKKGVSPMD